jgi:hypothetical protein
VKIAGSEAMRAGTLLIGAFALHSTMGLGNVGPSHERIDAAAPARNDAAQHSKGMEMGFNPGLLDHVTRWAVGHKLAPGMAVLDVGTSELFCAADPPSLNRFLSHFGAEPYADDELGRRANGGLAADLFQRAGFDYMAIDFAVFPHTLRLDLNVDPLPLEQHGRYALVTNSGTSEHILNQYNVFKVIHDATAPGGLMYHGLPMAGEFSHGIISYNPKFFWSLAEANSYEIVGIWGWAAEETLPLAEDLAAQSTGIAGLAPALSWLERRINQPPV